jgi:DNA-binding transcriptional ArsR family regulator
VTADRAASTGRPTGRTRAAILGWLRKHPGSTPAQIADGISMSRQMVRKALRRMAADGLVRVVGTRGHYFVRRGSLSLVTELGDNPVRDTCDGDTSEPARDALSDIPQAEAPVPGDTAPWRCPQCGWRQAVGTVASCEACGCPRSRTVPR